MALTDIDRSLLKRCLAHEPEAWRDFVNRFTGLFYHVISHAAEARSVRLSPADQEDVAAEIFVRLLQDDAAVLRRFRGEASLATYLCVVARRIAVQQLAQQRASETFGHVRSQAPETRETSASDRASAQSRRLNVPALDELESPQTQSVEQRIDDRDFVEQMLAGLGDSDAELMRLFHLEGRSYREISVSLGIPENSIGPSLSRVRARLERRAAPLH